MHDGIGGGWTMNVLSNGDGMTMSGLWKISETKGIYIKKNNIRLLVRPKSSITGQHTSNDQEWFCSMCSII